MMLCLAVFEGPSGPHSEGVSKVRNGDFVKITVLGSKPDPCQDCGGAVATKETLYVDVLSVTVFGIVTGTSLSTLHWYPVQIRTLPLELSLRARNPDNDFKLHRLVCGVCAGECW